MPSYIRVAANIKDPFTKVSMIRSVAFKSDDGGTSGPFGSVNWSEMTDIHKASFVSFVEAKEDEMIASTSNGAYKKMLVPSTGSNETLVNEQTNMIAFHDYVYTVDRSGISPVENSENSDLKYYVYIYAKNETGYEFIQPSGVTVIST
jgi:hypothetical protein